MRTTQTMGILAMVLASACAPPAPAVTPQTGTMAPASPTSETPKVPEKDVDPWLVGGVVREEWLPLLKGPQPAVVDALLPAVPKGVPGAPKTCDAFVKRTAAPAACGDKAASLALLDEALNLTDVAQRDKALVALNACASFEPGLVRALRAELAPSNCADVIVEPALKDAKAKITGAVQHAMIGLAIAARLERAVASPPELKAPFTKERVSDFVKGPMMAWYKEQAIAVEELSKGGAQLSYYGKGLAALGSGHADLRLVDAVRSVPVPDDFRKDPELATAYYASLDEALEPRKARGRDGALVGMRELAHTGILVDDRVRRTRALLAKLFGGRRVDSLDGILLTPVVPDPNLKGVARLAASLPTFYAGLVIAPEAALDPLVLRGFANRGVSVPHRVYLKDAPLSDESRAYYARLRLALGATYWRADDVDAAASHFSRIARDKLSADDRLAFASALALRGGPDDLAVLMKSEGNLGSVFGNVRALDSVAAAEGPLQGQAAYNAAFIRQLAMPRGASADRWQELVTRYDAATKLLKDAKERDEATQRARAAEATAKTLEKK